MDESEDKSFTSCEDSWMSPMKNDMVELTINILGQLHKAGENKAKNLDALKALCQITGDVLKDGNLEEQSN